MFKGLKNLLSKAGFNKAQREVKLPAPDNRTPGAIQARIDYYHAQLDKTSPKK